MTLDDLAEQPDQAATLTPQERRALLVKALAAVVALASASPNGAPPPPPAAERALRVAEAAARLAMTKDYIHRTWRTLPGFFKDADGHVKIREGDLRKYLDKLSRAPR